MTETLRGSATPERRTKLARFFEALEANAEGLWHVPELSAGGAEDDDNEDEDDVYGAAYEAGQDLEGDITLHAGDVIMVPERGLLE